ncbi:MAG TPA: cation:proton antiporter [Candidatus Acidoferrales bacterium]|jgi:Kef-type K+ transport system membrane component KefB|nr:cation:proton antiporter [Candidatus Acidoferrales bacterium]
MQPALQLALLLAILLPATKLAASFCSRFNVPPIIGELMVGVLMGPGAIGLLNLHVFRGGQATGALMLLAQVGAMVLMFIAGVETDIDRMREASVTAFLVALSGVIWPFLLGAGVAHIFGLSWRTACFLGGALTATSVSISARTLMDAGRMASKEATVILGAAVIDDVMGLFVLAFLAASITTEKGAAFGVASTVSDWLQQRLPVAASHPLIAQMTMISVCVAVFFVAGYALAKKYLDPLILLLRKLTATEAVPSCVLALVLVYAVSAEWFGSVAAITGAYLIGYVFAGSEYKADIERSFYAIGHGLLIPLFFVSIGLTSDYRALGGHWLLLAVILFVAIIGKLFGCGLAALASGMDKVRSFRVGCGMISRGEVGLIVTAMAAATGIFSEAEIAVMVAVVLLTTLVTPLALRGAFQLRSQQDFEEGLLEPDSIGFPAAGHGPFPPAATRPADAPPDDASFSMLTTSKTSLLAFGGNDDAQEIK